jgi:hypothetical protein
LFRGFISTPLLYQKQTLLSTLFNKIFIFSRGREEENDFSFFIFFLFEKETKLVCYAVIILKKEE